MSALGERIRAGEPLAGALVRMPAEEVVEMLAVAGLDFVLIDCEHGPADLMALRHHLALAQLHDTPVLVRIGEGELRLAQRALDHGAAGIVAPHVESAAAAQELVEALHYPPRGRRGFATYPRAGRFGTVSAAQHLRAGADTVLVAMLESPGAIRDAAAILGVEGVDAYLVGPADLGATRAPGDPAVAELLAAVHRDRGVRIPRADLVPDPAAAAEAFADGAQLVVYNIAQVLMRAFAQLRRR